MAEDKSYVWTDIIRPALERVYPGELEKGELAELTGLSNDDMRAGFEVGESRAELNLNGEGFALNKDESDAKRTPAAASDEDREGDGGAGSQASGRGAAVAAAASLQAPGSGPSYRVTFSIQMAFAGARGDNRDDAAWDTAKQLEVMVADAIAEQSGLGCAVEVEAVEAFDSPRVVPRPPGKDEPEPEGTPGEPGGDDPEEGEQDGSSNGNGDGGDD